jgi:hypothetical protein
MMLALGSVVIALLDGLAATQGHSSPSKKTTASWGLYPPARWSALQTSFARRGFAPFSVRVVTGTALANGQPFAVIAGRSNAGRQCFAVARGNAIGRTICRLSKPLTVFSALDKCAACSPDGRPTDTRTILVLVRADVTVTMIHQGHENGIAAVPAGNGFAFNTSFVRMGDRLRARNARGRLLVSIRF